MVIHRIGIQMFNFNLGLSPVALNNLFVRNSNIHNYNTRNKNKLRSAIGRHKFIYKNFRYISVDIWNNITDKIDTDYPITWLPLLTFKKTIENTTLHRWNYYTTRFINYTAYIDAM